MIKKFVATFASAAMAVALVPAVALGADTVSTTSAGAAITSYQVYGEREAQYGNPPDGEASTEGLYFNLDLYYDGNVKVADAAAAVESICADGVLLLNGSALATLPKATASEEMGNDGKAFLRFKIPVAMAIMGGMIKTVETPINGVTVNGQQALLPAIATDICTGLRFHVSSMTVGTATTPASTTITIDQTARLRSMNHVVWTSNGSAIMEGTGNDQTTPAHHHEFWANTPETSAKSIQTNAMSENYAALNSNYTVTCDGATVTITAKTAKAGEYLGVYNYDDAFLQGTGIGFAQHVSGLAAPTVGQYQVSLSTTSVAYDGKAHKDLVTVTPSNYATYGMTEGTDYEVSYSSNAIKAGKVTVTVTGKGIYSETHTVPFSITPKTGKISSISAGKGKFTVKWSETGATTYKVQYRVKGASKWSSKTVKNAKSTTVKSLKSGKTYQVKVTSVTTAGNTTTATKTVKVK